MPVDKKKKTQQMRTQNALGRTLMKDKKKERERMIENYKKESIEQKSESVRRGKLKSIIQTDDLTTLMQDAELNNKEFEVVHQNAVIITNTGFVVEKITEEQILKQKKNWNNLVIPRRPHWKNYINWKNKNFMHGEKN